MKAENSVNVPTEDYLTYMAHLSPVLSLLSGTRGMREAGEMLLPRSEGESEKGYAARLKRSFLKNYFRRTLQKMTGEVLSKKIVVNPQSSSKEIDLIVADVDQLGNDITRFSGPVLLSGIADGFTAVQVDYPDVKKVEKDGILYYNDEDGPDPGWKQFTAEVEQAKGWRPYFIHIKSKNIIGGRAELVDGKIVIKQLRIKEYSDEPAGSYGTKRAEHIRVLEPGKWELYEEIKDAKGQKTWEVIKSGTTALNYIPVHFYKTGEALSLLTNKPPLEDLADMNICHWQSSSDQRNILHYSRFAMWFGKMLPIDGTGKVKFGGNRLLLGKDPESDLKVVEHTGKAIEAGRNDLKDLEEGMAMYGLTFMMPKTGNITATSHAIDSSENDSSLKLWALQYQDFLKSCFETALDFMGAESEVIVEVNTDFKSFLEDVSVQALLKGFEKGLFPRELVFDEYKRRGIIHSETDFVDVLAMIEDDLRSSTV